MAESRGVGTESGTVIWAKQASAQRPLLRSALRRVYHAGRNGVLRLRRALGLRRGRRGRFPDLVEPQLYSEKLRWRMLYDRRPLLQMCSDRLGVREYVAGKAGEEWLVPLLGVWDRPEDVPWEELSPPYVVKATHGCGWNIIVGDQSEVDPKLFRRQLSKWLRKNFYYRSREWSYKHVPRRIMIERFVGIDGRVPDDFKIHCFHGEPKVISVYRDRFTPEAGWNRWDTSWNHLTFLSPNIRSGPLDPPPARLPEMLELARKLSQDFDYIRVDLYCVGERVYFGELTPTPAAARSSFTEEGEAWLGAFWNLPTRAEVRKRPVRPR